MADRGMKKYLPFASLIEQQEYLDKMEYEKNKIPRPLVSIEQARKIDRILHEYDQTFEYSFKLFIDGYIFKFKGKIVSMNLNKKIIYFDDFSLPIKDIIDIEDNNPFNDIC